MATFRDLARDGDKHLIAATSRVGVLSQHDAARVASELAMLSRICGRVLDDILDGFPARAARRTAEGTELRAAAESGRRGVQAAERRFEWAVAVYGPNDDTAGNQVPGFSASLRSAIQQLGLAEEVLQTELTPGAPGRRRPKPGGQPGSPRGLGDPDTVREIVSLTGRWIGLVGEVADQIAGQVQVPYRLRRIGVEPISDVLQQSAAYARRARHMITGTTGPATQLSERLALLPTARASARPQNKPATVLVRTFLGRAAEQASALRKALNATPPGHDNQPGRAGRPTPDRPPTTPPVVPESGAQGSVAPVSARSLRYVATSAGSVHTTAAIVARQLAARVAELSGSTRVPQYRALINAADALIESGRAWHAAARGWDHVVSRDLSLNGATTHATGTVMQLGNAAYADPDWTPTSPNTTVRPASEFATDLNAVRVAAAHLDRVVTAYTGAARASGHAIGVLHDRKALFAELGEQPIRASHEDVAGLCNAYDAVVHRAVTTERWLRTASAPAGRNPADAPALAAADFPNQPLAKPDPDPVAAPTSAAASVAAPVASAAAASLPAPASTNARAVRRP